MRERLEDALVNVVACVLVLAFVPLGTLYLIWRWGVRKWNKRRKHGAITS